MFRRIIIFLGAAALAGCATVQHARDVQRAQAEKSRDDRAVWQIIPASSAVALALPQCVDFALTNRPSVVSARLAVEDSRVQLKQIAANAPVLSSTPWNAIDLTLSAGYDAAGESTVRASDAFKDMRGNGSAALSLDLLVYDFGRNAAEAQAQVERVLAAEQTLVETSYLVFEEVASGSFDCREKLLLVKASEENEAAFRLHLEKTEGLIEAGEARKLDVLRARLDLAKARESLQVASNEVFAAFAEFRHALGIPAENICPEADLKAVLGLDYLKFTIPEPITLARTNAPAMRVARARLRAASADVDKAIADLYPSVSASASLNWSDPFWVFKAGARATQSLFQGFGKMRTIDRAVLALQAASADVDAAEQKLMRDLEVALTTRVNAREARLAAEESLVAARENLAVITEQQRIGEASRIEFSDAQNSVADAQAKIVKALCAEQKADAALFRLTGTPPVYVKTLQEILP